MKVYEILLNNYNSNVHTAYSMPSDDESSAMSTVVKTTLRLRSICEVNAVGDCTRIPAGFVINTTTLPY